MPTLALYAAGSNSHGQLGIGSQDDAHTFKRCIIDLKTSYTAIETPPRIRLAAGANHTVLLVGDQLYKAGSSAAGQLGVPSSELCLSFRKFDPFQLSESFNGAAEEDPTNRTQRRILDIAAGWETTSILSVDGRGKENASILSMGSNELGQLGSSQPDRSYGHNMQAQADRLISGPRHIMALSALGSSVAWGAARHGQLGVTAEKLPANHRSSPQPIVVDGCGKVRDVAAGHQHSVLLHEDGAMTLLGSNRKGQLGCADPKAKKNRVSTSDLDDSRIVGVHATWNSTFVITEDSADSSRLFSFGNNAAGQLGRAETQPGAIGQIHFNTSSPYKLLSLAAGSEHVLALLEVMKSEGPEKQMYGWGWNEHGNLGQGDNVLEDIRLPRKLHLDIEGGLAGVFAGNGTSWIAVWEDT